MKSSLNPWPYGIIVTFVLFISATIGLVIMACGQKADLVSADYYEQEIRFQSQLDRAARARAVPAAVSYEAASHQIKIELPANRSDRASAGRIQLYRPSSANLDRKFNLDLNPQGVQCLDASALASGLWKVRVSWTEAHQEFYIERSVTIK